MCCKTANCFPYSLSECGYQEDCPEQIGGFILEYVKKSVCTQFKVPQSTTMKAVITVPAYFHESQRAMTAAKLAGIDVL